MLTESHTNTHRERLAEEGAVCWGSLSKRNPLTSTSQSCTKETPQHHRKNRDRWGKRKKKRAVHVTTHQKDAIISRNYENYKLSCRCNKVKRAHDTHFVSLYIFPDVLNVSQGFCTKNSEKNSMILTLLLCFNTGYFCTGERSSEIYNLLS